jgi:hypothetical protein
MEQAGFKGGGFAAFLRLLHQMPPVIGQPPRHNHPCTPTAIAIRCWRLLPYSLAVCCCAILLASTGTTLLGLQYSMPRTYVMRMIVPPPWLSSSNKSRAPIARTEHPALSVSGADACVGLVQSCPIVRCLLVVLCHQSIITCLDITPLATSCGLSRSPPARVFRTSIASGPPLLTRPRTRAVSVNQPSYQYQQVSPVL